MMNRLMSRVRQLSELLFSASANIVWLFDERIKVDSLIFTKWLTPAVELSKIAQHIRRRSSFSRKTDSRSQTFVHPPQNFQSCTRIRLRFTPIDHVLR